MADRAPRLTRPRVALTLALLVLFLGAWTWIPAPVYALLALSVGAPDEDGQLADALAAAGYVVCAIDYRHAPQWRWPSQLDDVRAAIAWARAQAADYSGDGSRLALLGRSSGSELAFVAGATDTSGAVRALVLNYSPVDLADGYRHPGSPDTLHLRDIERDLFGGSVDERPDAYRDASPITCADRPHPPVLMINGGRDRIVYPSYAQALYGRLAQSGDARLLVIPWADHAFRCSAVRAERADRNRVHAPVSCLGVC